MQQMAELSGAMGWRKLIPFQDKFSDPKDKKLQTKMLKLMAHFTPEEKKNLDLVKFREKRVFIVVLCVFYYLLLCSCVRLFWLLLLCVWLLLFLFVFSDEKWIKYYYVKVRSGHIECISYYLALFFMKTLSSFVYL